MGQSREAAVVRPVIYGGMGWSECGEAALQTGWDFLDNSLKGAICWGFWRTPFSSTSTLLELLHSSSQLLQTFISTFVPINLMQLSHIFFPYTRFLYKLFWNENLNKQVCSTSILMQTVFHLLSITLLLFWQHTTMGDGTGLIWYYGIANSKCTTVFGLLRKNGIKVAFSNTLLANTIAQWAKMHNGCLIFRKKKIIIINSDWLGSSVQENVSHQHCNASKDVHIANNVVHGENKWPSSIYTHKDNYLATTQTFQKP